MNLRLKYILILIASMLLSACAMENRTVKSSDDIYEMATEEDALEISVDEDDIEISADYKVNLSFDKPLVNQKLQDFYDLIALQNKHPEFTKEVTEQLRNYTNDTIKTFADEETAIIKNIKQLGDVLTVNDSTQKIRITYDKVVQNLKTADTIFVIVTNKTIMLDDETLISKKIHFSKN